MTHNLKRRRLISLLVSMPWLGACAQTGKPQTPRDLKGIGMVVEYELAPGASEKEGVVALTDAGNRLFGKAVLDARSGGTSSSGGSKMSFPRWVRVTWRKNTEPGEYWTTGIVVGDYTVEVLSRIPAEAFDLVRATPGSAIKLRFRIKDDGVLFGWAVEQHVRGGYRDIKQGGDFID